MTFRPCGHSVACVECSSRMKQCFHCHERIQEKVRVDASKLTSVAKCKVCDAERVAMEFRPCKHRVACIECSRRMKACVECKQAIQEKVLFDVCKLCLNLNCLIGFMLFLRGLWQTRNRVILFFFFDRLTRFHV